MSSAAGTAHALRDRPLGKVLLLAAVLLAALLVSRSCGSTETKVSQTRAVAIARTAVDFTADRTQVRYVKRGLQSQGFWAVSLVTITPSGTFGRSAVVLVDATSGKVVEIRR